MVVFSNNRNYFSQEAIQKTCDNIVSAELYTINEFQENFFITLKNNFYHNENSKIWIYLKAVLFNIIYSKGEYACQKYR